MGISNTDTILTRLGAVVGCEAVTTSRKAITYRTARASNKRRCDEWAGVRYPTAGHSSANLACRDSDWKIVQSNSRLLVKQKSVGSDRNQTS